MTAMTIRRMTGRCATGAERDGGALYHAVPAANWPSWQPALCGAKPGARGNGWALDRGETVTCPCCLRAVERNS
jgi:hypothetical protein